MEPQDYIRLKMYCMDSLKWSESKFERSSRLQPMFFSSLMVQESMTNMASYEMEFNKMAKKQHKKTMGLELSHSIQKKLWTHSPFPWSMNCILF